MLHTLRTHALRIDLCSGSLSRMLACAGACEPDVDGGAPISLYVVSEPSSTENVVHSQLFTWLF